MLTNAQCSHRQAGEMGLRGQNSWVEAGSRRQREAELCSWWVMGTITSIEKPLSSLWDKPRIWRFLLAGKGSHWESPRSVFVPRLAGDQHPGLPSLGQAPLLPQPPAHLGKTPGSRTLRPSSCPSAVAPGLLWAGQFPPALGFFTFFTEQPWSSEEELSFIAAA